MTSEGSTGDGIARGLEHADRGSARRNAHAARRGDPRRHSALSAAVSPPLRVRVRACLRSLCCEDTLRSQRGRTRGRTVSTAPVVAGNMVAQREARASSEHRMRAQGEGARPHSNSARARRRCEWTSRAAQQARPHSNSAYTRPRPAQHPSPAQHARSVVGGSLARHIMRAAVWQISCPARAARRHEANRRKRAHVHEATHHSTCPPDALRRPRDAFDARRWVIARPAIL